MAALTFTAFSIVALHINVQLFLINLATEFYPANDPFGPFNELVVPCIVHLLIGSASFFVGLFVFLSIERNGLRFRLNSFLFGIGLVAMLTGLAFGDHWPISPVRATIFLALSFGVVVIATIFIFRLICRTNSK
jgi:hypothetical protein